MKTLIKSIKFFGNNKGESLIESLVSIFVLSLLVVTISSIIQVSLRISNRALESAETMQETFNPLLENNFAGNDFDLAFTFNAFTWQEVTPDNFEPTLPIVAQFADPEDPASVDTFPFVVNQDILLFDLANNRIFAFRPDN